MDCRDAYRSLRLRLRHCLLWCRELSMLPRTLVFAGCLGVWCRAFRARIVYMLPRTMVPRARPKGLVVSAWYRALVCCGSSMVPRSCMLPRISASARLCDRASVVPRILILPRTRAAALSSCCREFVLPRTPWCRAPVCCRAPVLPRTRRSAAHSYISAHPWCRARHNASSLRLCFRAVIHAAVQFYVRPRIGPLLPHSTPYFRALSYVAAQCYVLPRTHGAARGTTLRVFACPAAH